MKDLIILAYNNKDVQLTLWIFTILPLFYPYIRIRKYNKIKNNFNNNKK